MQLSNTPLNPRACRLFISAARLVRSVGMGMAVALWTAGCTSVNLHLTLDTSPPGARVSVDGEEQGMSTLTTKKAYVWDTQGINSTHTVDVAEKGYEPVHRTLEYAEAQANKDPWTIHFELQPLEKVIDVEFISDPPGATVSTDSMEKHMTPVTIPVKFTRTSSTDPWVLATASFELENYFRKTVDLHVDDIEKDPHVKVQLEDSKRVVPVDIEANVDGAEVQVNGAVVGNTPLRYNFTFTRSDPQADWETFLVAVNKEGYCARRQGGEAEPGANPQFSKTFTEAEAVTGHLKVELDPISYIYSTVPTWDITSKGLRVKEERILSKIGEIEKEPKVQSVTRMTNFKPKDGFVETRISVMPDSQSIVYAIGFAPHETEDTNEMADPTARHFSNIWLQRGNERTRLTDGMQFDVEPCVSSNGITVFFSSDRLNPRYTIWSMQTKGRGGLTKVTDSPSSFIDTEAAVSPDDTKIAYTSYIQGSEAPQIWIIRADGTLPTQVRIGEDPAWSPDGTKIAFTAPDADGKDKLWVMDADGSNPTQKTFGDQHDRYPCWMPDGSGLVYASDQAINEEHERNYDIWRMNADGTGITQLTVNGSYDTRPAVSPNGKFVYFISNRGAQAEGDNSLQIWRIELPSNGAAGP